MVAPAVVTAIDAEALFQTFLTTCRLSDLISDVGRGEAGVPMPAAATPRLIDDRTLVRSNDIGRAADQVLEQVRLFSQQFGLGGVPGGPQPEGMAGVIGSLHQQLTNRIAGGGPAVPDGVTAVMNVNVTLPQQAYCQQAQIPLIQAQVEATALFESSIQLLQLLQPPARDALLQQLRTSTNELTPPGPMRDQRLWQIELLESELLRRSGQVPAPIRPRPIPVS